MSRFKVPSKVPAVLHNGSLSQKNQQTNLRNKLNVLGKTQKRTKVFSIPIEKVAIKVDKDGNEDIATIFYKIKFIDSAKFMTSSLSNLVDNPTEGIREIKCKGSDCFLEHKSAKDTLIKYKWLSWKKDYSHKIDEELKKQFKNTFKLFNNDINKFIWLLWNSVCPYEYIDEWENFNETSLPKN